MELLSDPLRHRDTLRHAISVVRGRMLQRISLW